jgi:GNAT superfamily N-acetyltransferase
MGKPRFAEGEIEIREAAEPDVAALTLLLAERGFDYPTKIVDVRERFLELYREGDRILVAVRDSNVIGMVTLHRTRFLHRRPDGRIVSLVISESHRSRGAGAFLVKAAEAIFREWGCGRVEVTSGNQREGAHRFYLRSGYSIEAKRFIKRL